MKERQDRVMYIRETETCLKERINTMTNKPLKQKYLVVEVRLFYPTWIEAKGRIYQHVITQPITEVANEGLTIRSDQDPHLDHNIHLHCWQDQQSFTVGQEVYLTVEVVQ